MIYNIQTHLVTDLASEPIDTTYFKSHARIDFNTDDALIQDYIVAARQELEAWSGLSFGVKTWRLTANYLPNHYRLPNGPVDTITAGTYDLIGDTVSSTVLTYVNSAPYLKDVDVTYTTKALADTRFSGVAKNAVARYAAGLYAIREHIIVDDKENPVNGQNIIDEAKQSLKPFKTIVLC